MSDNIRRLRELLLKQIQENTEAARQAEALILAAKQTKFEKQTKTYCT